MGNLSKHFDREELACRHCGELVLAPRLLPALEQLRDLAGAPVIIHDAYRCPTHNAAVGGVSHSRHVEGQAADLSIDGKSYEEMYRLALEVPALEEGGIGVYDTPPRLHVDVREGGRARWAVKGANEHQLPLEALIPEKDSSECAT